MIIKITNKRILILTMLISVFAGIFVVFCRYDWTFNSAEYNNFLFIHDDDINTVGFHTFISVMNVILLFPMVMELLTDHKETNEIYIVSRISSPVKFYFIKFIQIALMCFVESFCYNTSLCMFYCSLGTVNETLKQLISIYVYTVIIGFLIAMVFATTMQLLEIFLNERIVLVLIIVLFCVHVVSGLMLTHTEICITNYYFISLVFAGGILPLKQIVISLVVPLIFIIITAIFGGYLYKHSDRI